MDAVYFLGRFHVLALHLPIGIIVALFVLEWLARRDKYRYLAAASPFGPKPQGAGPDRHRP